LGAERLVVGHNPVKSGNMYLNHPYWGSLVTVLDTKISEVLGGELTAFEMNLNEEGQVEFQTESFKRPQKVNRLNRVLSEIELGNIGRMSSHINEASFNDISARVAEVHFCNQISF
jgi:hypothetical protein